MANQSDSAEVTFNCQTHAVTVSKDNFVVDNGDTLILTMTLKTTGGSCDAKFPPGNQSFDFPNGGPPQFTVHQVSDTEVQLTETNHNPNKDPESFCFKSVVQLGHDKFQSTDPTIQNLGTGGGAAGGGAGGGTGGGTGGG